MHNLIKRMAISSLPWLAVGIGTGAAELRSPDRSLARDSVEIGWRDDFQVDRGWLAEPWQAEQPDRQAATSFSTEGGRFEIRTPNSMMAWTRTVNPIWVEPFCWLEVEYECSGGSARAGFPQLVLSDDSTGPVTPNALNPENPLAGEHEAIIGPLSPDAGIEVFDLRGIYPSDRIGRITLRLAADDQPAGIVLRRLALRSSDPHVPASQPAGKAALLPASDKPLQTQGTWIPVVFSGEQALAVGRLAQALACSPDWPKDRLVRVNGVGFRLRDGQHAALATGIMELAELRVSGQWRGSQLGLLLASRVFGNAAPWYGPGSKRPRRTVDSPHQLRVRVDYEDGTSESHFPFCPGRNAFRVESQPQAYTVPLDAGRTVVGFAVIERMSYGQVFLLAASINTSEQPGSDATPPNGPSPIPEDPTGVVVPVTTTVLRHENGFTVKNGRLRLVCDAQSGLRIERLVLADGDREIISPESASVLIELRDERGPLPAVLRQMEQSAVAGGVVMELSWSVGETDERQTVRARLEVSDRGLIKLTPSLHNGSSDPWRPTTLRMPGLRGCRVAAEASDCWYLVGTRNALLSNRTASIQRSYGGPWPLPIADLYAASGGGLGLFFADTELIPKTLEFSQEGGKANLAVRFDHLQICAGGTLRLPPVYLLAHAGDWHETFAAYRQRIRVDDSPGSRLSNVFYCRRDYPLGGTGFLFDPSAKRYTPGRLMRESARAFGGLDMIDISGWAYHEGTGRVGDYLTNDLGGLAAIERLVRQARRRHVPVGLYFEGYLLDKRCELARRALPAWQFVDRTGKPRWWSGEMEFFVCPGVKAWRQALASMAATVAGKTGADAVYVDQFGISDSGRACWSPDHGHPVPSNPLREELALLQEVRDAVGRESPGTALYIEYVPADGLTGLVDAAFDIGMSDALGGLHPTKLPLYRYVFPELVSFEMLGHGIRPVPFEADDLHRAVFHGMGIWLKGRAESWYTRDFCDLARRAHAIFAEHGDVFRSSDCEPLIPTLRGELYANRFSAGGKTLYTLYNAGHSTVAGELFEISCPAGSTVTELLSGKPANLRVDGSDSAVIRSGIDPGSTAVFLVKQP